VNKQFLIVDDSYIDRLVAGMLVKRSFNATEVLEVSGGQPALEYICNKPPRDLVILLDIMMPQMNGFEFLEKFEQLDQSIQNETTIIMLSSTIDPDDIERARKHKCVKKLLSKPLSANELKEYL
jgi:CheY-like chemotaxis protein